MIKSSVISLIRLKDTSERRIRTDNGPIPTIHNCNTFDQHTHHQYPSQKTDKRVEWREPQ